MPLIGAGGTFVGASLLGFGVGILADARTGGNLYAFLGLFAGMLLGAYGAFRLLSRSL
ncbi:MAG: hypothetical protein ACYDCA_00175 [Candidatus Tyrphobacter sp.]